jgi:phosphate:Na+ symporter
MGISQVITLPGAIAVLLGANIGTCFTGLIASLRLSLASRRASIAQIIINIVGVLLFLPFLSPFANLVSLTSTDLARQIANAHTIFNVVVSAVLFPFIGAITRVSERLVPKTEEEEGPSLTKHIDDSQYRFPDLALTEAARELNRLGEATADMIIISRRALLEGDLDAAHRVLEMESELIDPLCDALEDFINELTHGDLNEQQRDRCEQLKHFVTDIERVGDLTEMLAQAALRGSARNVSLSEEESAQLGRMFDQTHRIYALALQAVRDRDRDAAQLACQLEDEMDRMYWKARRQLSDRLETEEIDPEAAVVYSDLIRHLERISDHADRVSISVIRAESKRRAGML